jgi:phosphoglycolate phosphatase
MKQGGLTLVLFDIDGTLLDTHGAGRQSFINALAAVFGWQDDIGYIQFAGATDLDVLARIAARRGHRLTAADEQAFLAQLPRELARTLPGARLELYPGVRELLRALSADPRAQVGLVTGNIEPCARLKLQAFDLHDHFTLGAFGHEHADRKEIARLAVRRAQAALAPGRHIAARFLIGDTPSDVAAAHAIDATALAVATGSFPVDALHATGARHVLQNLADTRALLGIMGLA